VIADGARQNLILALTHVDQVFNGKMVKEHHKQRNDDDNDASAAKGEIAEESEHLFRSLGK
jgi:hypothetical protein